MKNQIKNQMKNQMKKQWKQNLVSVITGLVMMGILSSCSSLNPAQSIGKNASRLEAIKTKGVLSVAMEPYFAPNEFIDPSKTGDDRYVGSDVEMAKYIAQKLGVELEIVPLEFSAVLSSITEGKYDLAISALAYTPARAQAMILSDGYYFSEDSPGYGLVIRSEDEEVIKSAADLANQVVVAQSGSLQELFANDQIPVKKELKRVSSTTDGLLMVQENKADAIVVAKSMAQLYIDANKGCGLEIVQGFEFTVDKALDGTRVGIPLGEEELAAEVNRIIAELLASGQYEKWYNDYSEYAKKLGL